MSGPIGNIPDLSRLGGTSIAHRQSVDSVQGGVPDDVTDAALIFDMRNKSNMYVEGVPLGRQGSNNSNQLKRYLEEQYNISSSDILINKFQNKTFAILVPEEQKEEKQVVFMDITDKYPVCISMKKNENISTLFGVHFDETGLHVDAVYVQGGEETPCSVLKTGEFGELATQPFGRIHLFLDKQIKLGILRHIDENQEQLLYIDCNMSDAISAIRRKLKKKFCSLFQRDTTLWFGDCQCILQDTTMIGNTDGRHMLEDKSDPGPYILTLFTGRGDTTQVKFNFKGRAMITIIQKNETIADLRQSISKIIHDPAACIKLTIGEEELPDVRKVSDLLSARPKAVICVETTTPQERTFIHLTDESSAKYTLTVYKLDPLDELKRKLASKMKADPFKLQLYRNGSVLDGNIFIGNMGLGREEEIEVVVHSHRIRVFVKSSETGVKRVIVDDSSTFTVCQLQQFLSILFNGNNEANGVVYNGMALNSSLTLDEAGLTHECTVLLKCLSEHDTIPNTGSAVDTVDGERETEGPMDVTDQSQVGTGGVLQIQLQRYKAMNTRTKIHGIREEETLALTAQNSDKLLVTPRPVNMPGLTNALTSGAMMPFETGAATATSQTAENPWRFPTPAVNTNQQFENTAVSLIGQTPQTTLPVNSGDNGAHRGYTRLTSLYEYYGPQSSDGPSSLPVIHRSSSDYSSAVLTWPGPMSTSSSLPSLLQDPTDAVPDRILYELAEKLGTDWCTLGIRLGLEKCHLDSIRHDNRDDLRNQAFQMLSRWKLSNGKHATAETLCISLRECELVAYADSIGELITRNSSHLRVQS